MDSDILKFIIALFLILVVIIGGVAMLNNSSCAARTADIGMEHRWSFMGGCQVRLPDNTWIPLDNYRYMGD